MWHKLYSQKLYRHKLCEMNYAGKHVIDPNYIDTLC